LSTAAATAAAAAAAAAEAIVADVAGRRESCIRMHHTQRRTTSTINTVPNGRMERPPPPPPLCVRSLTHHAATAVCQATETIKTLLQRASSLCLRYILRLVERFRSFSRPVAKEGSMPSIDSIK